MKLTLIAPLLCILITFTLNGQISFGIYGGIEIPEKHQQSPRITTNSETDIQRIQPLTGFDLKYSFSSNKLIGLSVQYIDRTINGTVKYLGNSNKIDGKGDYIDVALEMGLNMIFKKSMLEFILVGGVGIPLQRKTESDGSPIRKESDNYLDNTLPFVGFDLPLSYELKEYSNSQLFITIKPFLRGHFCPLYDKELSQKDFYLTYGISLGLQLKKK